MKKLSIVLCILWVCFIFYNSCSSGYISHKSSFALVSLMRSEKNKLQSVMKEQSVKINPDVNKKVSTDKLPASKRDNNLDFIVRKNAHAFEYLILAVLVSDIMFINKKKGKSALVYIMFICLLCAVLDEFNQKFSINRTSSVGDVLIDFAGSIIGIGIYYFIYYNIYNRKKKINKWM